MTRSTGQLEGADSDAQSFTIVQVAIKAVNHDTQGNEEMAAHEGSVLSGLKGLNGVPAYFGNYQDPPTRRWHRQTYILTE